MSVPVERRNPETKYGNTIEVSLCGKWIRDHLPESQGLVIRTDSGSIVLLGCGHSGVVKALSQDQIQDQEVLALMGCLHLFNASDNTLQWIGEKLREIGVRNLMAVLDLDRRTAVVGAVGSRFALGKGIHPTAIAI
ncbi:MAG: hypothetical protein OXE78_04195 [Gammaproteobacteria bacterium]|nr:hypothetical protein [Gammaproteobacteria bacterium]